MQMLESEDITSSNSLIAMTTHEQVLQWVANIMFSSSLKLTKSIQTTLKTTALGLGGLGVALSGSMHSDQKCQDLALATEWKLSYWDYKQHQVSNRVWDYNPEVILLNLS